MVSGWWLIQGCDAPTSTIAEDKNFEGEVVYTLSQRVSNAEWQVLPVAQMSYRINDFKLRLSDAGLDLVKHKDTIWWVDHHHEAFWEVSADTIGWSEKKLLNQQDSILGYLSNSFEALFNFKRYSWQQTVQFAPQWRLDSMRGNNMPAELYWIAPPGVAALPLAVNTKQVLGCDTIFTKASAISVQHQLLHDSIFLIPVGYSRLNKEL